MWKSAHDEDIPESKLLEYLENWGLDGGIESFHAWTIWRRSNYVTLPVAGGWWDQPKWIRDDFLTLDLVRTYHDKQAQKPSVDGLKDPTEGLFD